MPETRYWRSVEELRGEPPPRQGPPTLEEGAGESRRDFLKLMGFSLTAATAAALTGCTRIPERQAVPLLAQPEGTLPGVEAWYATTCAGCSAGCGLLVKTRDGRPIKIEGNPLSPLSRGATCAVGQATVLSLYDDQRLKEPLLHGRPASWADVDAFVTARLEGGHLALITETIASPSSQAVIEGFLKRFPGTLHAVHDPVSLAAVRHANGLSFGRPVVPRYRFDRARVIVGLEADFLGTWLSPVEFARDYARGRRPDGAVPMSRHYQFESGLSLTGSNADRRVAVLPSEIGLVALALAERLAGDGSEDRGALRSGSAEYRGGRSPEPSRRVAGGLRRQRSGGAGGGQPDQLPSWQYRQDDRSRPAFLAAAGGRHRRDVRDRRHGAGRRAGAPSLGGESRLRPSAGGALRACPGPSSPQGLLRRPAGRDGRAGRRGGSGSSLPGVVG